MTAIPADGETGANRSPWTAAAAWCRENALWLWAAWFIGFGLASAAWPRDYSLDVLHYHLHNGWAFLNGRGDIDYAPANLHSFLNPYYQAVVWWLVERIPGPVVAYLLGLVHAVLLPALYWLARNVTRAIGMGERRLTCVLIAVAGMGADPVMKLFASIRNDHIGATAFIAAIALCIPPDGRTPSWRRLAVAGALVGLMFGLKSTNAVYVVGLAVMVLAMVPGFVPRARAALAAGLGGIGGIVLGGGAWFAALWTSYGNPVFPNLNSVFGAPMGPDQGFPGYIRVPDSLGDMATLPIRAAGDGMLVNWYPTTDPRVAIVYLGAIALVLAAVFQRRLAQIGAAPIAVRPAVALALTVLISLFVWMATFSTHRYAMALWSLAPLVVVCLVFWLRPAQFDQPKGLLAGVLALLLLGQATTYAQVNRQPWQSWSEPYVWVERPVDLPESGAFILMTDAFASTFAAPFLGAGHTYGHVPVKRWSESSLANYRPGMLAALEAHDGPVFVVTNTLGDFPDVAARTEASTGLSLDRASCRRLSTSIDQTVTTGSGGTLIRGLLLCPAARASIG